MSFWNVVTVTVVSFLFGIATGLVAFYDLMVAIPINIILGVCNLILSAVFIWLGFRGIRVCRSTYRYRNKW